MLGLLTGCSSNNNDLNSNNNTNNEVLEVENTLEETTVYTQFTALGKVYESTKDINQYNEGDTIYDNMSEPQYIQGEYKEVDFALELLTEYLAKNQGVYDFIVSDWNSDSDEVELISGDEKQNSIDEVNFLGEQFMLNDEDPIYFKLGKVILQEKNEENNSFALELRGYLSATNGNFRPLGTFTVTVYTKEDKLYGSIL